MLIKCQDDVAEETYIRLLNNQSAVWIGVAIGLLSLPEHQRFLPFVIAYVLGVGYGIQCFRDESGCRKGIQGGLRRIGWFVSRTIWWVGSVLFSAIVVFFPEWFR